MTARSTEPRRRAGSSLPAYLGLFLLVMLLGGLVWWMVVPGNPYPASPIVGTFLSWLLLPAAVLLLGRVPRRRRGAAVLAGTVALGLIAVGAPPRTSNDSARYAWDGIVQKAGISPYAFVPIDETLEDLRPGWLFLPGSAGADGQPECAGGLFGTSSVPATNFPSGEPLCTAINRPHVPTIYPPTAELYFLAVRAAVPDSVGYLAFQLAGLLLGAVVTAMLLRLLGRRGLPLQLAAVWGWSPFLHLEGVNNAHVDLLGGALVLAAAMLLVDGRPVRSGVAFGAAVATKLIPVIAAPALLFRRPVRFIAAAAATFVLLYVPYLTVAGAGVLGFLPGYLREEGYSGEGGIRFGLAQLVSTGQWPPLVSAAALALVALAVLRGTRDGNVWEQQTLMIGLTLLIVSPNYPWYALMLLPFIVLSRRWEYLGIILALDLIYMVPKDGPYATAINQAVLLAAAAAIGVGAWLRRRGELRRTAASRPPATSGGPAGASPASTEPDDAGQPSAIPE